MNMTLPANNYYPISVAETSFIDMSTYAPFVQAASEIEGNPLERIKLVAVALIGGSAKGVTTLGSMKPLPIPLGSTAQGSIPGGIKLYCERMGPNVEDNVTLAIGRDNSFRASTINRVSFYFLLFFYSSN